MAPKPKVRESRGKKKKSDASIIEDPNAENPTAQADVLSDPPDTHDVATTVERMNASEAPEESEPAAYANKEIAQSEPQPESTPNHDAIGESLPNRGFIPINKSQPAKKYQPKAVVRRTQEERQAFEREQNLRQSAARSAGHSSRGQRSRRGDADRFGHRGRGREPRTSQASGIFGGPTIKEKPPRAPQTRPNTGESQDLEIVASPHEEAEESTTQKKSRTSTKVKKEDGNKVAPERDDDGDVIMDSRKSRRKTTNARTKTKVKVEEMQTGYISDEARWDDDVGPKVEIAKISLLSDEEPDLEDDRRRIKHTAASHLRPVRLEREEHKEPDYGINTEASSLGAAEIRRYKTDRNRSDKTSTLPDAEPIRIADDVSKVKRKPRDVNFVRAERRWKGVYEDDDDQSERSVKKEPRDDDAMDLDDELPNEPASVRSLDKQAMPLEDRDELAGANEDHPLRRPKPSRYFHPLPPDAPILLDEEDPYLAEMARIVKEVQAEEEEEAAAQGRFDVSRMDPYIHDLSDLKGDPSREGKIYLMQLPPILPKLRDFCKPPPDTASDDADTSVPDAPRASSASRSSIKPDPDVKSIPAHILNSDSVTSIRPPIGCPGTISFYKSGKIMANWGGLELEINEQHKAGFAQEVLVHDWQRTHTKIEDSGEWEETIQVGGEAYAVGEVEGGFIAGPDLGSLLARGRPR